MFLSIEFSCWLGLGLICILFRAFKPQNDWEGYRDSVRECRCHQRQSGFLSLPVSIDFSSMARLLTVVGTSADTFFPFLIEFFCWIGLDLIRFCFGFLDSLSKRFFVKFINMQKLSTVLCFLKLLTVEFPLLRHLGFFFDPFWKIDSFIFFLWCFRLKLSSLVLTKTKQSVLSLFFLQFGVHYKKA